MKLRFLGRALPARPIFLALALLAAVGMVAGREHPASPPVVPERPETPPATEATTAKVNTAPARYSLVTS